MSNSNKIVSDFFHKEKKKKTLRSLFSLHSRPWERPTISYQLKPKQMENIKKYYNLQLDKHKVAVV